MDVKHDIITVRFRCKRIEDSPVLGKIDKTFVAKAIYEFMQTICSENFSNIKPELGDFYALEVASAMFEYTVPTDRESVMDYLSLCNVPLDEQNILEETRTRELENEGMTRSDAQGVVDVEVKMGKLKVGA